MDSGVLRGFAWTVAPLPLFLQGLHQTCVDRSGPSRRIDFGFKFNLTTSWFIFRPCSISAMGFSRPGRTGGGASSELGGLARAGDAFHNTSTGLGGALELGDGKEKLRVFGR